MCITGDSTTLQDLVAAIQSTPATQNLRFSVRGSGIEINTRVIEVSDGNTGAETISRLGNTYCCIQSMAVPIPVLHRNEDNKKRGICLNPEHAKEQLSEFGKHFLEDQGLLVPISVGNTSRKYP